MKLNLYPLKPKLTYFSFLIRTAKKTQRVTITKINRLMLFKEIIDVYSENRTEHKQTDQNVELLNVKVGGTFSYH
jgi:hypothetical protein